MTTPTTYREVFRGGLGRLAVGLLLLEFVSASQVFVTATVLPLVSTELDGDRYYGVALSAATVALFIATPATAPLMLRLGPRTVLLAAGGLHLIGTGISAISSNMPIFALGRLVQGFGTGALMALGYAVLAESFPARLRPRVIALLTAMWLLPSLVGPAGSALVASWAGWRVAVAVSAPLLLVAVIVVAVSLPAAPAEPSRPRPVPARAVAVMATGAGMISYGGSTQGWTAGVLLVAGLALALAGAGRVLPPGTLAGRPPQCAAIAALVLATFLFIGGDGLTALLVTQGLHRPIGWAAAVLSIAGVAWSIGTLAQPRLLQQLGGRARPVLATGAGLAVAGTLAVVALLAAHSASGSGGGAGSRPAPVPLLVGLAVAWWAVGTGLGLLYPTLSVLALQVPAADAAAMSGAVVLAEALGGTLSLAVGGSAVSLSASVTGSFDSGLVVAYAVFALAGVAAAGYARRTSERVLG